MRNCVSSLMSVSAAIVISKTPQFVIMKFDPNDTEDKALLESKIEEAVAGLKKKNSELVLANKKLREIGGDPEALARVENELEEVQEKLKASEKQLKDANKAKEKAEKQYTDETVFTRQLLVDNGLTDALSRANVAPGFLPAVKALLAPKVQITVDGDKRVAKVGDKDIAAFVTEWSQGDEGKQYVKAPTNGGGGASGGAQGTQSKKFSELNEVERVKLYRENPQEFERQRIAS